MTMRPGPTMAARVRRRRRQVRRGVTSLRRIVPNAPWMSPSCASVTIADLRVERESFSVGSRPATIELDPGARFDPVAPFLGNERLHQVVYRNGADQVARCIDHAKG